jgi:putative transposase
LFFINIKTRKVHIAGLTQHPTQQWVYAQVKNIIPKLAEDRDGKVMLIRDRDSKYPKILNKALENNRVTVKVLPCRSPNLNAYAESWIGKIKQECLNYFIVFGERHLRYLISEYVRYHNTVRPHQGLGNKPTDYRPAKNSGKLKKQGFLGGLLNHYYWE